VRLSDSTTPEAVPASQPGPTQPVPALRIAVASVLSPKETFRSYQDLIAYVGKRVGQPTEFIQRSTYGEVNALARLGKLEVAFVCTLAYVEARREFGAELLATPVINGVAEYYSNLIVPAASSARTLQDLRGGVFAFTDPLSNSGWLSPTYLLWRMGESPEAFFERTMYTFSHDNSIRAVADALVDGAAVDSLVFDSTIRQKPALGRRLRVIDRAGPYAAPPVIVNPSLPWHQKAALREVFLTMHEDLEGKRLLDDLAIDRFTALEDRAFDRVREMRDALTTAGLYRQ
jgi:phosphonate transport system substrate-binding protein